MENVNTPLNVALSLDIDPDANVAVRGRHDTLSSPVENNTISTAACKEGLAFILELFNEFDIDATLFYEARTAQMLTKNGLNLPKLSDRHEIACHSLKHEDFLGKVSGLPMQEPAIEKTIHEAKRVLKNIFGQDTKGFRAPYTAINRATVNVLERLGFQYDSSETVFLNADWACKPYLLEKYDSSLLELALPLLSDSHGKKISSYFWAIFEGKRVAKEHIDSLQEAKKSAPSGLFIFSIHPWHIYVNSQGRAFAREQARLNRKSFEYILSQLKQMRGIHILRLDEYINRWPVQQVIQQPLSTKSDKKPHATKFRNRNYIPVRYPEVLDE